MEHFPLYSRAYRRLTMALGLFTAALFIPATAAATIIEIEPDDYAEGTELTNISPYVTLQHASGMLAWPPTPIYATNISHRFSAPTGELGFGRFAGGPVDCEDQVECYTGFSMTFHQPVNWVSLDAINFGYPPGIGTVWQAFDETGALITEGIAGNGFGEPYQFTVAVPGMRTLIAGGEHTTGALEYDYLRFELPEPTLLPLFGFSLAGLYFIRRRKVQQS